jgi:hypothetical protein
MPVEAALEKECRKDVEDVGADMTLGEEGDGTYEVGFLGRKRRSPPPEKWPMEIRVGYFVYYGSHDRRGGQELA